jgi:hypothetical protein
MHWRPMREFRTSHSVRAAGALPSTFSAAVTFLAPLLEVARNPQLRGLERHVTQGVWPEIRLLLPLLRRPCKLFCDDQPCGTPCISERS